MRHRYGRYEVIDTSSDVVVCYSGSSEYADQIVQAMNKGYGEVYNIKEQEKRHE